MFVQFLDAGSRWSVRLMESCNIEGRQSTVYIGLLGSIPKSFDVADRVLFWDTLGALMRHAPRLAALTPDQRREVFSIVKVTIPEPTKKDVNRVLAWLSEARDVPPSNNVRPKPSWARRKELA